MTDNRKNTDSTAAKTGAAKPALISRRNLLKHGAAAMPAVLTLQSGAALAASSAYIGSVSSLGEARDGLTTNVLCLDVSNAEPLPNGTTYRFVNTNYANAYSIPDGHYHSAKDSDDYVLADEFCRTGGDKVLNATGNQFDGLKAWEPINLPHGNNNGILVSSTALSSISAAFTDYRITQLP